MAFKPPTTLYDYYNAKGQSLPTISERAKMAQSFGIQNYAGTAQQNNQLLSYLFGPKVVSPTSINLGQVTPVTLVPTPITPATTAITVPEVPQAPVPAPEVPQALDQKTMLVQQMAETQSQIDQLESDIGNSANDRSKALDAAGVYDNLKQLNTLKDNLANSQANLRDIQDQAVAIPLQALSDLRGRQGTKADFNNYTSQQIQDNALQNLASSRVSSRMADQVNSYANAINSQIVITNQQFDEQKANKQFLYEQKSKYLTTLQTSYASITNEEQKEGLELAKSRLENDKAVDDNFQKYKQSLLNDAIKNGDTEGQTNILSAENMNDLITIAGDVNVTTKTAMVAQQSGNALDIIKQIDGLLDDKKGLESTVGPNIFSRNSLYTGRNDYVAKLDNFTAENTLAKFSLVKSQGVTFGALSEGELKLVENSSIAIRRNNSGGVKMTEEAYKKTLNDMKFLSMKVFIGSVIGKEAANAAGLKYMAHDAVVALYEQKYGEQATKPQDAGYFPESNPISETIKKEEHFEQNAYLDSTGKPTIGYGTTVLNGRPVKMGDTISKQDAEQALARDIQLHSNFAKKITVPLNTNQQAALASFEYNLGPYIWDTATGKKIMSSINSSDFDAAAELMKLFNKALNPKTGVKEPQLGLTNRRAREAKLLLS